jgi:acetyl esterase/lipase
MVLALLCVLRDQGLPLPAGASLISPWVDLTHSFPSGAFFGRRSPKLNPGGKS